MAREENAFDSRSNTPQESEKPRVAERPNIPSIPRGKHKLLDVVYRLPFTRAQFSLRPKEETSRKEKERLARTILGLWQSIEHNSVFPE